MLIYLPAETLLRLDSKLYFDSRSFFLPGFALADLLELLSADQLCWSCVVGGGSALCGWLCPGWIASIESVC
jgi:hypothetical protein